MIRVLAMIAVAGFLLSAACLGAAVAIAGPDLITEGLWSWSDDHLGWSDGHNHHGFSWNYSSHDDSPQASRDLAWSGESVDLQVPGELHFTQSDGPAKLSVHGPRSVLDHLRIDSGRIYFDRPMNGVDDLTLELTAPKVTRFAISGSGKLDIASYRQDALDLRITGDGEANAHGDAKTVKLDISGSGESDLTGLATDRAEVTISGSGHARVGPRTYARLDISGSGDVTLTSRPQQVESHVSGSGSIDQEDGDEAPPATPPEPPKPAKPAKVGKPV